jgi:hypothetical protein
MIVCELFKFIYSGRMAHQAHEVEMKENRSC